jgi:hypothetical protein
MAIFKRFIQYMEKNFASYFEAWVMLQKLMISFGPLRANKYAETLVQAVPERFSRTANLTIIFACCRVRKDIIALLSD